MASKFLLSHLFPYAYNIPLCILFSDPAAPSSVEAQSIYEPEENLEVRIDFDPDDALCTHFAAGYMDHDVGQTLMFLVCGLFPTHARTDQRSNGEID